MWEGGHRVPFIVSWPDRISRPRVDDPLICLTDVITSVAELCGIRLPSGCAEDSISMAGHLLGVSTPGEGRQDVVYHSVQGEFAIQKANWKLIVKRGSGGFSVPKTVPIKMVNPRAVVRRHHRSAGDAQRLPEASRRSAVPYGFIATLQAERPLSPELTEPLEHRI